MNANELDQLALTNMNRRGYCPPFVHALFTVVLVSRGMRSLWGLAELEETLQLRLSIHDGLSFRELSSYSRTLIDIYTHRLPAYRAGPMIIECYNARRHD